MITQGLCNSYKREIFEGIHAAADRYMVALYRSDADLSPAVAEYQRDGEVTGSGYEAGGVALTGFRSALEGAVAFVDFEDPSWANATITARGALIYNASKGNRAVAVLDFGEDVGSVNAPFRVRLPNDTAHTAVIRSR